MNLKERLFGNKWQGATMTVLAVLALFMLAVPIAKGFGWDVSNWLTAVTMGLVGLALFIEGNYRHISKKLDVANITHSVSIVLGLILMVGAIFAGAGVLIISGFMAWVSILALIDIVAERFF